MKNETRSWHWADTLLFLVRTFYIYFQAGAILPLYVVPQEKWLMFAAFAVIYIVPYLFYRPGAIFFPAYVAAETLLTGSLFLFFISEFQSPDFYEFLFLPLATIGFVSQTKPLLGISPMTGAALLAAGTWAGGLWHNLEILGFIVDSVLIYGFGFALGRLTFLHDTRSKLVQAIEEKNKTLEQYAKKIEELTLLEERNRVSQDLHDTVGHTFTSIITSLDALLFLQKVSVKEAEAIRREIQELALNGAASINKAIYQIEPLNTAYGALRFVAESFMKHTGMEVSFLLEGTEPELKKNQIKTLVRCLQESLTNARRHGGAAKADVTLTVKKSMIQLCVQDNGTGKSPLVPGFGLKTMQERLLALGGTLAIESNEERGTRVVCCIPI